MLHTTRRLAKAACACKEDYFPVVEGMGGNAVCKPDTPIPLDRVLEIAGLSAAIWALRCVLPKEEADCRRLARLFACECAELALPIFHREYPDDDRPRQAIETARRFANGDASEEDLSAARSAAESAAWSAARSAAESAAWSAARKQQEEILLRMLRDQKQSGDASATPVVEEAGA